MNQSQFQFNLYERVQAAIENPEFQKDPNFKVLYPYQFASYLYATYQILPRHSMPRGVLLMYQMGAGKTMPSIAIAARNAYQRNKRVVVICKKSVRDNYIGQFQNYVRLYARAAHEGDENHKNFVRYLNKLQGLVTYVTLNSSLLSQALDEVFGKKIDNAVVVMDEVHNFFNMTVGGSAGGAKLLDLLVNATNTDVVLISGTPMVNDPFELVPCINILKGREVLVTDYEVFFKRYVGTTSDGSHEARNLWDLQNRSVGCISYSPGDVKDFPELRAERLVRLSMTKQQLLEYMLAKKKEDKRSRVGGFKMPQAGQRLTSDENSSVFTQTRMCGNGILTENSYVSPKADAIVEAIMTQPGIHLVYSQFLQFGIFIVKQRLEALGFSEVGEASAPEGKGFIVVCGKKDNVSVKYHDSALKTANRPENNEGQLVRVILISAAASEGINFKCVRYVHIMEPYWNMSRLKQVIARGRRNHSHVSLPEDQRTVQPIIYISTESEPISTESEPISTESEPISTESIPDERSAQRKAPTRGKQEISIDQQIYDLAAKKEKLIDAFTDALKCVSINCVSNRSDALNCVICENEGVPLYDENDPSDMPRTNPCARGLVSKTDKLVVVDDIEYVVSDVPPMIGSSIFSKQVYRYSKKIDAYIRVTGPIVAKVLIALKKQQP